MAFRGSTTLRPLSWMLGLGVCLMVGLALCLPILGRAQSTVLVTDGMGPRATVQLRAALATALQRPVVVGESSQGDEVIRVRVRGGRVHVEVQRGTQVERVSGRSGTRARILRTIMRAVEVAPPQAISSDETLMARGPFGATLLALAPSAPTLSDGPSEGLRATGPFGATLLALVDSAPRGQRHSSRGVIHGTLLSLDESSPGPVTRGPAPIAVADEPAVERPLLLATDEDDAEARVSVSTENVRGVLGPVVLAIE